MRGFVPGGVITVFGLATFVTLATSVNTAAEAAPIPQRAPIRAPAGDHNRIGNGKANNVTVDIRSPAMLRGIQLVTNFNAGGLINTTAAACKKHRHCRIHQRIAKNKVVR